MLERERDRDRETEEIGAHFEALSFSVIIVFDAPITCQIGECNKRRRFLHGRAKREFNILQLLGV